ncbi:MAG TPA: acetate uptake transporter [Rhodocyclaceae bacterium]|nr:acetate uptake transporter [Rhodocyclaceae bacterium]
MADHAHGHDHTANPAPLGLLGFGMTTVLLNLHNAGLVELGTTVLAMGIFYGGICQVLAGLMEWKKGNTFGTVAFTSYGFFWLSLVAIIVLPKTGLTQASSATGMAAYLLMWGVLTFVLFIGSLKLNRATQFVFASLTVLFALLAGADLSGSEGLKTLAGWEGMICGASAIYLAAAQILNEIYGRNVLPLGECARPVVAGMFAKAA